MSGDDQWITFDCYGTLLDWQTGFRSILAPVSGGRADDLVSAFHAVEPKVEDELAGAPYRDVLRESVRRSAAEIGLEMADQDLNRLPDGWHTLGPFPDTVPALQELRDQGWRLGILTNCDNDLFESTRAALGVSIDAVVTSQEVGTYKPNLGHFTAFESRTGVARENWVHAAVSWWHDMEPARTFGLRRVWVDRENSGHDESSVTERVPSMAALAVTAAGLYRAP